MPFVLIFCETLPFNIQKSLWSRMHTQYLLKVPRHLYSKPPPGLWRHNNFYLCPRQFGDNHTAVGLFFSNYHARVRQLLLCKFSFFKNFHSITFWQCLHSFFFTLETDMDVLNVLSKMTFIETYFLPNYQAWEQN